MVFIMGSIRSNVFLLLTVLLFWTILITSATPVLNSMNEDALEDVKEEPPIRLDLPPEVYLPPRQSNSCSDAGHQHYSSSQEDREDDYVILDTEDREAEFQNTKAKEDLRELSIDKLLLFGGNPSFTETGERIVEGDIVVPKYADDHKELSHRKGTINLLALWSRATVYYTLHYSLNPLGRRMIREAMEHWENMTCVKFQERTTQLWYVRFRGDRNGCWSSMGRSLLPLIGQDLSIGNRCEKRYVVVHEVGHALGLNHEQSRLDRDRHVRVLWRNIALGGRPQFWRGLDNPHGVEYDLTSIMHYHPQAFSSRMFERNTVVSRNPHHQRLVGKRRNDLSFRDAKVVNSMYRCDAKCPNRGQLHCENGGYLGPFKEGDEGPCPCVCPPHTRGERCQEIVRGYYDDPPCGGNITDEAIIETPGFPERKEPEMSCSWIITAPSRKEVEVEFYEFSFRERLQQQSSSYYGRCVHERVEIRNTDYYSGTFYCGTDIEPGTKMTSKGGTFIILITADDEMEGKGLRARVRFV
ncbi:blastula protease 10-like [Stegodyphus dumicola]|uniref:blastula protease 10-like n=1 Tax=Stegodyphus dumicola TaxID=202533 RepID=UPI0015AA6D16|nr:blastula protease 10-like [Stegodyphus dumicola]